MELVGPLTTNRRSLLAGIAGGWMASAFGPSPTGPDGRIVGAAHRFGHLLRDGFDGWKPVDAPAESCDVAIVGSGVSGLGAAWRLSKANMDLRLLELESFVGGTSTWGEEGPTPHPWGAHYLTAPNREASAVLHLLDETGAITGYDASGEPRFDGRLLCHAPQERLFFEGAWHEGLVPPSISAAEREELDRFSAHMEALRSQKGADGRYLFQIPVHLSSRDPATRALDRLTMGAWLAREGYSTRFVLWYVRYAMLDDFGGDPDQVSAWAGHHYFASRRPESPELLGSHYLVWPEGNGRLVQELVARSDAEITRGALVVNVSSERQGVVVEYLHAPTQTRRRLRARAVIVAAPSFVASRLVSTESPLPPRIASPWLVANLHVERPYSPNQAWDSVLFEGDGLGYVDASHQRTDAKDATVWTYFRAFGGPEVGQVRRWLADLPWTAAADLVLRDLAPAHPHLVEATHRLDAMAWGHAMPRPAMGFLDGWDWDRSPWLAERIAWAHVDQSGMALFEEALTRGVEAAEAVASKLDVSLSPLAH